MMKDLFGLVVCGGESSRMGMDKSLLVYHKKSQHYHVHDMLKEDCEEVIISCNKKQASAIPEEYRKIVDHSQYENIGPMAALLSAFSEFPDKDFITIGCDYPFLTIENIKQLIEAKDGNHIAACFYNSQTEMKEPLLAYYSKDCFNLLLEYFNRKDYSLRNFLKDNNSKKIEANSINISSVDTPEGYHEALLLLREMNGNKLVHSI